MPHAIVNGGIAAMSRKDTSGLGGFLTFSNAGSWGSNHTNAMLGAFGDGRVQTIPNTVANEVLCNLAAKDATVSVSL